MIRRTTAPGPNPGPACENATTGPPGTSESAGLVQPVGPTCLNARAAAGISDDSNCAAGDHFDPSSCHPDTSGTLCYIMMISYMISEDNDIDYDIIGFEMSMIS